MVVALACNFLIIMQNITDSSSKKCQGNKLDIISTFWLVLLIALLFSK